MTNECLDNQAVGENLPVRRPNQPENRRYMSARRKVKPTRTYFTDQALPPDDHIESHSEDYDFLQGLWPEETKSWFTWTDDEKSRAIRVAVEIEELCDNVKNDRWWRKQVKNFINLKVDYDQRKCSGKHVDPIDPWPFDPDKLRQLNLPDDLPALYTVLARFHDWMTGFDEIFSYEFGLYEFLSSRSYFKQRSVHIKELKSFLECVKEDLEANHVYRQPEKPVEEKPRTADKIKGLLPDEHMKSVEAKEAASEVKSVIKLSEPQKTKQIQESEDDSTSLSPTQIAEMFSVPLEPLRKRLARYRKKDHTCFIEITNRTRTQPQFLYYLGQVKHLIESLQKASSKMSNKRPSKKKSD